MINPYLIIAAIILSITASIGGYSKGRADANAAWELRQSQVAEEARAREQVLQEQWNGAADKLQNDRDRIAVRLDDALERLRERTRRLPEPARADCQGASGKELSAEDATFLARFAAARARENAALEACYKYVDAIR